MFERFTDRARRVVVLAQDEARRLGHNYIGTEHIFLGLIAEGEGVAATALRALGISLDRARVEVERIIGTGTDAPEGHIPFTPRAKKVLEMSLRESLQLGHGYIGTEHILLGLVREGEGVGAQVLVKLGADLESVTGAVMSILRGRPPTVEPVRGLTLPLPAGRCSFCLRSEEQVGRMVRGPSALICDECLVRASALVAEAEEDDPRQLPFPPPTEPPEPA